MTGDIKVLLDHASDTSSLKAFDVDAVVVRGRARARRRRFGLAGGAVFGVAVVTAATVVLTSMIAPRTGTAPGQVAVPPSPTSTPPEPTPTYTLPELDPAKTYYWMSQGREDDAAGAKLTAALVDYFAAHLPKARVVTYGPEFMPDGRTYKVNVVALDDEGSPFRISRYINRLVSQDRQSVHEQPVYRFWGDGGTSAERDAVQTLYFLSGVHLALDGSGDTQTDFLRVALYPAGGFRNGYDPKRGNLDHPSNGYLVMGCDTYDVTEAHEGTGDDRRFSFDCTESAGPNGERIVAVAGHETYLAGGVTFTINTVVVYRTDGTAIVVSDTPRPGLNWRQGQPAPRTPGLTIDALIGLALAAPLVTVA